MAMKKSLVNLVTEYLKKEYDDVSIYAYDYEIQARCKIAYLEEEHHITATPGTNDNGDLWFEVEGKRFDEDGNLFHKWPVGILHINKGVDMNGNDSSNTSTND